ncbi:MAG: hypothetical protein KDN19_01090 [Verrucomicrobiae bacterium]|nr:hypothetical protein [Verrucomicrobiae bacterium]
MNRSLVYVIYNLLLPLALLVGFPRFVMKGLQRGGLARNFRQRLGLYQPEVKRRLARERNLWIHAVSVGEVLVAVKLIHELRRQDPGVGIVLSTTTTTGFRVAEEKTKDAADAVTVIHNPVDLPWITAAALRRIRPERLVLVEAEVWPNLVLQARRRGIPVVLVNARLSDRSERRFRKFGALTAPVFSLIDRVGAPFEIDVDRWAGLGVSLDRIELTGSVKFDETQGERPDFQVAELRNWLDQNGFPAKARILLAGSTHAGEEALIGRVFLRLRERFPDLAYVVVPRHAERAATVETDLREAGFAPVLKQPVRATNPESASPENGYPCWIANTTGELRAWYYLSDFVVVGKSLLGLGGQNPVEPVVAERPTIVGPHMENFRPIVADLVQAGGLIQLEEGTEAHLVAALEHLLCDPDAAANLANHGGAALARHRGAAARTATLILGSRSGFSA